MTAPSRPLPYTTSTIDLASVLEQAERHQATDQRIADHCASILATCARLQADFDALRQLAEQDIAEAGGQQ